VSELREDPPVRWDGRCAVCFGPRLPKPLKPVYQGEAERDPFCSTVCARVFHGVQLPATTPRPSRAMVSQRDIRRSGV
jgi:hypothetical protein